jgi:flagellar protein FliO/FliZ
MLTDWGLLARALMALSIVLALMAGVAWLARRYLLTGGMAVLTSKRRLAVVEQTMLDGKSRLLLVRRDNTEHLLVLGPSGTVVVESGIAPAGKPRTEDTSAINTPATDPSDAGPTPGKPRALFEVQR